MQHSIQLQIMCGMVVFSFIVRSDDNVRYRMKCVLISTLEEYVCPEDDAAAGNWCRKAETRRLFELDPSLPRLYVMPITSILGKVPLVRAGNTGTIPHHMRDRKEQCFLEGRLTQLQARVMATAFISSISGP